MDGVTKHISGDNMRLIQKVITNDSDKDTNDSDINYNYKDTVNGNLSLSNDNFNIDNSDTESIVSDNSEYEF